MNMVRLKTDYTETSKVSKVAFLWEKGAKTTGST